MQVAAYYKKKEQQQYISFKNLLSGLSISPLSTDSPSFFFVGEPLRILSLNRIISKVTTFWDVKTCEIRYKGCFRKAILTRGSNDSLVLTILTSRFAQIYEKTVSSTEFECKNTIKYYGDLYDGSINLTISDDNQLLLFYKQILRGNTVFYLHLKNVVNNALRASYRMPRGVILAAGNYMCAIFNQENTKFAIRASTNLQVPDCWCIYDIDHEIMKFSIQTKCLIKFFGEFIIDAAGNYFDVKTGTALQKSIMLLPFR